MPGYFHGDTREYEKYPCKFAPMRMISHIEGFFKTLFKGKNFAVEWERGKLDFDHYFAFLTNFLTR